MLSALGGACPRAGVAQLSAPLAPLVLSIPAPGVGSHPLLKPCPLLLLLLQPMLVTSRESPAWLQLFAVPLPQTLPSGPGKAGGGSWLHAALPAWLPPLPQTGAQGLPAPGPAHPTAGVGTALPQPTQPGLCLSPLPAPPQCRVPCKTLLQQVPVLQGPGRSAVIVSPSP